MSIGLAVEAASPIWQVYEECAVLQSGHIMDKERVLYRFRMDAELYVDSPMEHIEKAGLRYLRERVLLSTEDRQTNLRNEFAEANINAFHDEFRLAAARLNPNFKQEYTFETHMFYETPNFKAFYEKLSPEDKLKQDERERQALVMVQDKSPQLIFSEAQTSRPVYRSL